MLVTSLYWWLYDGDRLEMPVAESLCLRLFQYTKSVIHISNLSPTHLVSNICHQHMICFNMIWFIRYGPYDGPLKESPVLLEWLLSSFIEWSIYKIDKCSETKSWLPYGHSGRRRPCVNRTIYKSDTYSHISYMQGCQMNSI